MTMTNLFRSEIRRALHRRLVWALLAIAAVGVGVFGVIAFVDSGGRSVADLAAHGGHPALLRSWWLPQGDGSILLITVMPLVVGALLGGASVAGAEWRAGTVTTVLSWEPRRLRLHAARTASCFAIAAVIGFVLQVVFFAAALPAVIAHGSTAGTDWHWWLTLVAAMARIALLTGAVALLGVSMATIGR